MPLFAVVATEPFLVPPRLIISPVLRRFVVVVFRFEVPFGLT
jgi:hypothetical protein